MSVKKSYDGMHVITHTVLKGESLSLIAKNYQLPNWQAIWLFNTKVREVYMGGDPDIIQIGQRLFIPRTPEGYDKRIEELMRLKREIAGNKDVGISKLEGNEYAYKAEELRYDLIGEIGTAPVGLGLKAARVVKTAKAVTKTAGQAKISAQYLVDTEAKEFSEAVSEWVNSKIQTVFAKKMDHSREKKIGKESSMFGDTNKAISSVEKGVKAFSGNKLLSGQMVLNVSEILLDYLSPSKIANAYLFLKTTDYTSFDSFLKAGETTSMAIANQKTAMEETAKACMETLDKQMICVGKERNIVYPPGGMIIKNYIIPPL